MISDDLIAFEDEIATEFNAGKIPYPVHLESGNENQLIEIFKDVRPNDWVFGSWRLHLKCLLKGVSREMLRDAIRRGESMALCFPEYQVYGSAIVGGTLPIALGVAMAIKRAIGSERVYCFVGDMTAQTGIFDECVRYAVGHDLPIFFIVEDNGVSVCSSTREVWGYDQCSRAELMKKSREKERFYEYQSKYPHAGAGKRVQF